MTPKRILLLPICGLGDAVAYLPYLRAIRAALPQAEIMVVVATSAAASILRQNSDNVEVVVFNRGDQHGRWGSLLRFLLGIRRRRFDLVISGAHPNSVRVPIFAALSGGKIRVGAKAERFSFLYNRRVDVATDVHYEQRYRGLLSAIGISPAEEEAKPKLSPPPAGKASALKLWHSHGLDSADTIIGMVSGADTNARGAWQPYLKRWNKEGYAEVARRASREWGARIIMIGSAAEAVLAEEITVLAGVPIVNFCGRTDLSELHWIISKCTAIISNDTGTMHLAGALGTPLLALFGPTAAESFRPPGNPNIIQGQSSCSPCYPHPVCQLKQCLAMDSISAPSVMVSLATLVGNPVPKT